MNNPEKVILFHSKHMIKLGICLGMSGSEYTIKLNKWSLDIKYKDNWICQSCGSTKELNAHHIFHKAKYPNLSLNLNNGITLCYKCHRETH